MDLVSWNILVMGVVIFEELANILSPIVGDSENVSKETKLKMEV